MNLDNFLNTFEGNERDGDIVFYYESHTERQELVDLLITLPFMRGPHLEYLSKRTPMRGAVEINPETLGLFHRTFFSPSSAYYSIQHPVSDLRKFVEGSERSDKASQKGVEEFESLSYQLKAQEALIHHLKTELAKFTSNKVSEKEEDNLYKNLTLDLWN